MNATARHGSCQLGGKAGEFQRALGEAEGQGADAQEGEQQQEEQHPPQVMRQTAEEESGMAGGAFHVIKEGRRVFFFVNKKEAKKTLLVWDWGGETSMVKTNKSFLLLFFKKEVLAC
jgi:hypothetical protein